MKFTAWKNISEKYSLFFLLFSYFTPQQSKFLEIPQITKEMFLCRSTKSEKLYPSMLSRGPDIETEPFYCLPVSGSVTTTWSQPTSPSPRGLIGLLSPTHLNNRLMYQKKNDEGKLYTLRVKYFHKIFHFVLRQFMEVKYHSFRVLRQCMVQRRKNNVKQTKYDGSNES